MVMLSRRAARAAALGLRAAYAAVFEQHSDAHWGNARHFVAGDRVVVKVVGL
jgi:hypothetical protein